MLFIGEDQFGRRQRIGEQMAFLSDTMGIDAQKQHRDKDRQPDPHNIENRKVWWSGVCPGERHMKEDKQCRDAGDQDRQWHGVACGLHGGGDHRRHEQKQGKGEAPR